MPTVRSSTARTPGIAMTRFESGTNVEPSFDSALIRANA